MTDDPELAARLEAKRARVEAALERVAQRREAEAPDPEPRDAVLRPAKGYRARALDP